MAYELQVRPAPQRLAGAFGGTVIELRELTYGQMRDAMRAGGDVERASESLLGQSLHVDGKPVGLDALLALPGRFAGLVGSVLSDCIRMHGLAGAADDEDATAPKQ
jgi:hypothetical protein